MKDVYAMTDDEYARLRIRGEQPREPTADAYAKYGRLATDDDWIAREQTHHLRWNDEPMTNDEKLRAALADLRADLDRIAQCIEATTSPPTKKENTK